MTKEQAEKLWAKIEDNSKVIYDDDSFAFLKADDVEKVIFEYKKDGYSCVQVEIKEVSDD